jgi:hypothetical protein
MTLNIKSAFVVAALAAAPFGIANGTGLATCDSGAPETWQSQEKLTETLKAQGWEIRKIKVDGGCYEVYAIDDKGERVEAYFHPVTLERVPIKGE